MISEVEDISDKSKKLYCLCINARCGHSFVMDLVFSHTLKRSARKNDDSLLKRFSELSSVQQVLLFEQLDALK